MDNHQREMSILNWDKKTTRNESDQLIYTERRVLIYITIAVQATTCRVRERKKEKKKMRRDNDDEEWRCRNMIKPVALLFSFSPFSLSLYSTQTFERERSEREREEKCPPLCFEYDHMKEFALY